MSGPSKTPQDERSIAGLRFAIIAAHFNAHVVDRLLDGALRTLAGEGVRAETVDVIRVPGAFEIPMAVKRVAAGRGYDAVIALAAVIRGETPHFDYVASECARGVMQAMLDTGVPVGFGVLTCDNLEQAQARAGGAAGNKGADAARAAMEMAGLLQRLAD
ncbi:MAG TPA: 6,7-dimethyl-8-ribityllumazine synthase [Gammaproteobacteria bacterium]|nr:6,7-dimethyl-8-ribityllumazine synthase [Gammaproteobacteria bacterium]